MKHQKNERKVVTRDNKEPGSGRMVIDHLLNDGECGSNRMFAKASLEAGAVVGKHCHMGESEAYYILSGKGVYMDDNDAYEVKGGDVTLCESGHSHGLSNTGDEPLVFIALIFK